MRNRNIEKQKLHRLNVNLTDGEYYTLQNLADYYHLTVSDYVKKSCNILGVLPQTEFIPIWDEEEKNIDLIDDTPEAVQKGYLTLREYYELEEEHLAELAHKEAEKDLEEIKGQLNISDII